MLQTMYCVERSDGPDQWVQEQCFKTEFKAFVNARAKSLAFTNVYRVIYQSPGLSGEVVRVAKGKPLLNSIEWLKELIAILIKELKCYRVLVMI